MSHVVCLPPLEALRVRGGLHRAGGLRRREEQAGHEHSARPLGDGLALPSRPGGRPLPLRPDDDRRRTQRRHPRRTRLGRTQAGDRLLLRLPDHQRATDDQRQPCDRLPGARGRERTGLSLLAGLQRLCARLPADHAGRAPASGTYQPCGRADRLQQRALVLPRLPGPLQPRSRDRVHRSLAGRDDPDQPARAGGRRRHRRCAVVSSRRCSWVATSPCRRAGPSAAISVTSRPAARAGRRVASSPTRASPRNLRRTASSAERPPTKACPCSRRTARHRTSGSCASTRPLPPAGPASSTRTSPRSCSRSSPAAAHRR